MEVTSFSGALRASRWRLRLSQLALAERAGVTQKQVSFLEQGRAEPRRATVLALAKALDLSLLDRDRLLASAGYSAGTAAQAPSASDPALDAALKRLLRQHEPFPAVVLDTRQTLLASNGAWDRLVHLTGAGERLWRDTCGDGARNLLRLCLHPRGLRRWMVDADAWLPAYIDRVRREAIGDIAAQAYIEQQLAAFEAIPDSRSPDGRAHSAVTLERYAFGGRAINLLCLVVTVGAPAQGHTEQLRVELFHPADDETATLLTDLAAEQS